MSNEEYTHQDFWKESWVQKEEKRVLKQFKEEAVKYITNHKTTHHEQGESIHQSLEK